jgi:hypothetical protein
MNRVTALPSIREQARHALLLLGAPAPARLVVDTHRALFDGDLDMAGLATLLRAERRDPAPTVCHGLSATLGPRHVALAEWSLDRRIVTPVADRLAIFTAIIRIAEFAAMRPGAGRSAERLLRSLATEVPGGPEALDLPAAARAAAESARADVTAEDQLRETISVRAAALPPVHRLFGLPPVPYQRDGA